MGTVTNNILWAVLCLSQVIYVVVMYLKPPEPNPTDVLTTIFPPLFVIALGLAVGTIWWRKRALVRPIQAGELDPSTPEGLVRGFPHLIINLVLSQSVSIYGLVLSFLSNDIRYVLGFVAAGLALMVVHRPFASELQVPPENLAAGLKPPPIA